MIFILFLKSWHVQQHISIYIYTQPLNAVPFLLLMLWRYKRQYSNKTLTLRKINVCICERALIDNVWIFTFLNCYFFNILLVIQTLCRYKLHACRLTCMYWQISKCTDKTPKSFMPPPFLATQVASAYPLQFFKMLFYINNDDKLCFFTRHVFFFISFIVSFSRYFSLQITILNSPMAFMHLAKVAQNWHIHLTSRAFGQCPVVRCWIMKYGPAARLKWNKKGRGAEKSYEK